MLPSQPKEFYKHYLDNYFKIKALTLSSYWKNKDAYVGQFEGNELTKDEIIASLKLEIRGVFFQSIETLFELLFALENLDDENIWERLANSDYNKNYERIKLLAKGDDAFLNKNHIFPSVSEDKEVGITFLQYVFFFYYSPTIEKTELEATLKFIREFLGITAKEFSDRDDYNAYKHGLRLFPTITGLHLSNPLTSMQINFPDSYAILKKKNKYTHHIKSFDIDRDIQMIYLCSELITNIITARKKYYFPTVQSADLYVYHQHDIDKITRPNLETSSVKFSMTPIKIEE